MVQAMHAGLGGGATGSATELDVDTTTLREKGVFLVDNSSLVAEKVASVGTTVAGIATSWADATGEDFTSKFQVFNNSFAPVSQDIVKLGQHMETFADKYEEALQTAINGIEE